MALVPEEVPPDQATPVPPASEHEGKRLCAVKCPNCDRVLCLAKIVAGVLELRCVRCGRYYRIEVVPTPSSALSPLTSSAECAILKDGEGE